MDTIALIQRAEQEVADGNRSAQRTLERARRQLLRERDAEGLRQLLDLAGRLEGGGDLPYTIRQNLRLLDRPPRDKHTPARSKSPWFVPLLGGVSGAVLSIVFLYWLLHGAGGDGMTWFAGGFVFLIVGIPLGGAVAHLVWHWLKREQKRDAAE